MANKSLAKAKDAKNDEFYTKLVDIELELKHYKSQFKGKVVLCNCDDPYESNFFKFFAANFNHLGLKKLIATCYGTSPIAGKQLSLDDKFGSDISVPERKIAHKIVITEVKDENGDGVIDLADVEFLIRNNKNVLTVLKEDGDFRSEECIELLKEADIVVTNPPFSLFREYVAQLIEYDKKFLIIGNQNALHYKEIFPYVQNNKLWIGFNSVKEFMCRDGSIQKFGNIIWYTNLDIKKRHELLVLYEKYSPEKYPRYMNFDGIDVDSVSRIPIDFDGAMGVPDNFLYSYNPEQFELIGIGSGSIAKNIGVQKNYRGRTDIAYLKDGVPACPYSRIIIRKKQRE